MKISFSLEGITATIEHEGAQHISEAARLVLAALVAVGYTEACVAKALRDLGAEYTDYHTSSALAER